MEKKERKETPRIAGRFEVTGLLGQGPSAKVYRVLDHGLDEGEEPRDATLKILRADAIDEESIDALERGAAPLLALEHPRIARLLHVGRTDLGLVCLEYEHAPCESLATLLERRGELPLARALEIARQILAGLEYAHERGVAHGGLHPRNVLLADRVALVDENPWAVGVKLADCGFAGLLGAMAAPAGDLAALCELYRVMVDDRAADLRADLEAASAPRPAPPAAPPPPAAPMRRRLAGYALAGAFALSSLVLLVLWLRARDGNVVVAGSGAELEEALAQVEVQRDRARHAEERLERTQGASGSRADELQARVDSLVADALEWKRTKRLANDRADELSARLATAEAATAELRREVGAGQEDLRQARARLAQTSRQLERATDPELLAAETLERVVSTLESGGGAAARAHFDELSAMDVARELAGLGFVDALTDAATERDSAAAESDALARLAGFERAGTAVARARSLAASAGPGAAPWMTRADGADRPERLVARLERLESTLRTDSRALSTTLETRWKRLLFENPDRDPGEVLAIADWFGDGRLEEFLRWYAEFLHGALERDDETLDLPELLRLRHLTAWADALDARPDAGRFHGAREILLYRYARDFGSGPPDAAAAAHAVAFQGPGGGPISGWRAELRTRARLLAPDSAYPGPAGSRYLYHTTAGGDRGSSSTAWRLDEVESVEDGAVRSWVVLQRFYHADGRYLSGRRVRLLRRGKAIFEQGRETPIVDLASPGLGFASRRFDELEQPSPRLPLDPAEIRAFRDAFLERDWSCAVVGGRGSVAWFSPDWGCVRVDDPERVTLQLVFASIVRE